MINKKFAVLVCMLFLIGFVHAVDTTTTAASSADSGLKLASSGDLSFNGEKAGTISTGYSATLEGSDTIVIKQTDKNAQPINLPGGQIKDLDPLNPTTIKFSKDGSYMLTTGGYVNLNIANIGGESFNEKINDFEPAFVKVDGEFRFDKSGSINYAKFNPSPYKIQQQNFLFGFGGDQNVNIYQGVGEQGSILLDRTLNIIKSNFDMDIQKMPSTVFDEYDQSGVSSTITYPTITAHSNTRSSNYFIFDSAGKFFKADIGSGNELSYGDNWDFSGSSGFVFSALQDIVLKDSNQIIIKDNGDVSFTGEVGFVQNPKASGLFSKSGSSAFSLDSLGKSGSAEYHAQTNTFDITPGDAKSTVTFGNKFLSGPSLTISPSGEIKINKLSTLFSFLNPFKEGSVVNQETIINAYTKGESIPTTFANIGKKPYDKGLGLDLGPIISIKNPSKDNPPVQIVSYESDPYDEPGMSGPSGFSSPVVGYGSE